MRQVQLAKRVLAERDWVTAGFALAILAIAMWMILLPLLPAVQSIALRRFHLQTNSFAAWSVQQFIPAMYNFENEYTFFPDQPLSFDASQFAKVHQLNHFPLRIVTFFDGRYLLLGQGNSGELELTSRYRSSTLVTRWKVSRQPDQTLKLELLNRHE